MSFFLAMKAAITKRKEKNNSSGLGNQTCSKSKEEGEETNTNYSACHNPMLFQYDESHKEN